MSLHLELRLVVFNKFLFQKLFNKNVQKGSFNGALSSFKAHELGIFVLQHILEQTNKTLPDEVIIGQALTANQGQNPARQTAVKGGLPNTITATVLNLVLNIK